MKLSKYVNVLRDSDKGVYLLHHTLYGGIIKVRDNSSRELVDMMESNQSFQVDKMDDFWKSLISMNMILDDSVNEENLVNFHYAKLQKNTLRIIPFVTNQCNFRCVYCYEDHVSKRMSSETYDLLFSAIDNLIEAKGYKKLDVSFFGGEPMLEYDEVCKFSERIAEYCGKKKIQYFASMTTNGYLLTLDKLKKLIGLHISRYMITVDGLAETHDRQRPLIGNHGSWEQIIQNLRDAKNSDLNFSITIRTNFNDEIIKQARPYMEFLAKTFGGDQRFKYHF